MRFDVRATGHRCDLRASRLLFASGERSSDESRCRAVRLLFVTNVLFLCTGNTACPAYLGPVLRLHRGVDDPASATGTDAESAAQFDDAYRVLRKRIEALVAPPQADLQYDRARLEAEFDRIGNLS